MRVLVTGGAGFIGSNFLNASVPRRREHDFINVDCLSYAANPKSLEPIAGAPNYRFVEGNIADFAFVDALFERERPELVVHLAAETHVDRSIFGPRDFVTSNVVGTASLLEACRKHWRPGVGIFHHVTTDEVYGPVAAGTKTTESSPYAPQNPYAATKAASDHLVRAYAATYGLSGRITTSTNNFGPRQHPEKLVPLVIANALVGKAVPIYGDGKQVRDWIYVDDHCDALWAVIEKGRPGETYGVGAERELANLDMVRRVLGALALEMGRPQEAFEHLLTFVADRPAHDRRYATDASKLARECGFACKHSLDEGLKKTVRFYLDDAAWLSAAKSGAYAAWIEENYGKRH